MQILGRNVEVIRYEGSPVITAYVRQLLNDCRRNGEPEYQCMQNCENSLVIARFDNKQPLSIKAVVPQEMEVNPSIVALRDVKDLPGLEAIAKEGGYELKNVNLGKMLYLYGTPVGVYNPCGMARNPKLFSEEVNKTIKELIDRVDELYEIAVDKPLDVVLDDLAVSSQISNPLLEQVVAQMLGSEGVKLLSQLRQAQAGRN